MLLTWAERCREKAARLKRRAARAGDLSRYRTDPDGYARNVLKVDWWAKQQEVATALTRPPYRVLVKASHSVGKSHVAAGIVNWWYDTRPQSICVTTAPKFDQVKDVLWKEIRLQRRGRGGFPGPKIPRLESAPDHYAVGCTAERAEGIQGQHGPAVLFVLDEAVGVPTTIWDAADSLMMGVEYGLLAICNPTDLTSEFYRREQQTEVPHHVISISCLEHPNIEAELAGRDPPYPSAVRLAWVHERILEWSDPVADEPAETDILWPPYEGTPLGQPRWYRPGPLAEARLLGRWPSQTCGVWSDSLFGRCETALLDIPTGTLPVVGCDVARFGDDDTAIHVRCGGSSLHHEWVNSRAVDSTAGRLAQLAAEYAAWATARREPQHAPVDPKSVPIVLDDDGVGGGVSDILMTGGYNVLPVNAGSTAYRDDHYPNVRSELWFTTAERARAGKLSLARLPPKVRLRLKVEAMAPTYKLDGAGRRVVEPKADTKKPERLGFSPDNMDAMNLSYYEPGLLGVAQPVQADRRDLRPSSHMHTPGRRQLFGMR